MGKKVFRSINEQIEILKNKGLKIEDEEETKVILLRENYFFISGYRHPFIDYKKGRKYINGSTFRELYSLFQFDRHFRNIIFKNILIIENNLKSLISYQLSYKYGVNEQDYLDVKNYNEDKKMSLQVNDVLNKIRRQFRVNVKHHSATMHYSTNYGYVPLWILVKVLSFGLINELYGILKESDRIEISKKYNLDTDTLGSYIALLCNYRNLCAHEDILYEHRTQRVIDDTIYHEKLNIIKDNDEYIYGKNDLMALIIIFKQMLSEEEFQLLIYEIDYELSLLDGKVDSIEHEVILNRMGFPSNWRDINKL